MTRPVALITGGTSGIGLGIAKALARDWDLALGYSSRDEQAQAALSELEALHAGARIRAFRKTLVDEASAHELYREVCSSLGVPSALIHSAGRIHDGLFLAAEFQEYKKIIEEHLLAGMALTQRALKPMYKNKFGRIIHLSSISSGYAKRGQSNYAAAKAGIEGFVRTLALEVAHRGITVNAIAPGLIETEMTRKLLAGIEAGGEKIKDRIPAGRAGKPEEIGALAAFLCSRDSSYITGAVIPVDGGRSLGDPRS